LDRDDTPEPQGYSQAGVVSIQIVFTSTSIHKGKTKRQTYPKISSQLREILDVAAFESPEVGDAKG
jgi:hypothetical protein